MTSFGYRLNPRYAIKECSSCGALYTRNCSCSKRSVEDKILVPKPPENYAKCGHPVNGPYCLGCTLLREKLEEDLCSSCGALYTRNCSCSKRSVEDKILVPKPPKNYAKCGHPVNGPYCLGCTLLREQLEEDLVTYFQKFQNTSESSDGGTNVVNAPREPFVVKQDHGVNPPHIDECCCECGEALDGIIFQRCACKSCGKGAHIGYNFPPKVPIVSNPEPCNQTMNNETPQTLSSFDSTCYFDKEISVPCVSKPNFLDESSNIFIPPPQPPIHSCEFCGSNAQYGQYCTPQAPFINPEPGYSQDFNFPQDIQNFQQQYICCAQCGGPHETFQCQQVISCFDQTQPPQFPVVHPPPQETSIEISHDQENELAEFINSPSWNRPVVYDDDDDDVDYTIAITPVLSIEEPDNSLSMGDELLDTILATESDEVISLVSRTSSKSQFEIVINSNDDYSSSDDDSLYYENIEYVEASPHDSELVSLEVEKIVILEDEEIEDDNLRENLLKVNLLIAEIEALKDNPTPSSEFLTKSSSTSPKSVLEGTNTFHNCLPEFENFCFDLEEISSGSTTTQSDISLPEYDSFIFNLSNDQFPSTDRSDFTHEEFGDEPAHIVSLPEYDCFYFRDLPNPGELISSLNSRIRENLSSTTCVNLPVEDNYSPLLAYVVWIFVFYLTYPVIPSHLHSFGNKDIIFDPGIAINHFYSFKISSVWNFQEIQYSP
nr:hypothetical protein [Tanacetum cinerariifolium]